MRHIFTIVVLIAGILMLTPGELRADVFAHNIRVTQPASTAPFDGKFTDGTGAMLRFTLSDRADSVIVVIKSGATTVRTIVTGPMVISDTSVVWDGKNSADAYVTTGDFTFSIATYDKGYAAYTEILYLETGLLSQRGMTTINNPALKNFGFSFCIDNGGYTGTTGIGRFAANLAPWGSTPGFSKLNSTGLTTGPGEARWATQADNDGYVYVAARTGKQLYRFHADSVNVIQADTNYGGYYPFGIGIWEQGAAKTIAIVANSNSGTATLTGDSRILTYKIASAGQTNLAAGGVKDTLLKGLGTVAYWDIAFGRDSSFYAAFIYPADASRSGIAKFSLKGKTLPLTMADTVWTMRVDSGRVGSCHFYFGAPADGSKDKLYFVNARIASGNPPLTAAIQGVYALEGLHNARPTMAVAYADRGNNASITKSDISTDAAGNIVYFENSNEEMALIAPPTGPNSYTTAALSPIKVFNSITIAEARVDGNGDLQPDSLGKTVTVVGIVNMLNTQGAAGLQHNIQDETGGIMLYKGGAPAITLNIGDRVLVTGVIAYFRGSTEITPLNVATDVRVLDSGNPLTPVTVTIPQLLANAEAYEARLIKIVGLGKQSSSPAWPALGADANFKAWDGWDSLIVRIDKDVNVDGSTEPVYPMTVTGSVTQYTSSSTKYNDGYQITPSNPSDIIGNVPVPPNPHFAMTAPANNSTITLDSAAQIVTFMWNKALDLNAADTALIYQWQPVGFSAVTTTSGGKDNFLARTGTQLLTYLGTKDTLILKWTVKTKDPANPIVNNADTSTVTIVRGLLTEVDASSMIPTDYALEQNFPNPFNPSTTIRVALPMSSNVTVTVYNMLGQQVATLFDGVRSAGITDLVWSGRDDNGRTVSSGVYLYRVVARSNDGDRTFVQNRKMMLLK